MQDVQLVAIHDRLVFLVSRKAESEPEPEKVILFLRGRISPFGADLATTVKSELRSVCAAVEVCVGHLFAATPIACPSGFTSLL